MAEKHKIRKDEVSLGRRDILVYAVGRAEHASAAAERLRDDYPGSRIFLAVDGDAVTPVSADAVISKKGLGGTLKKLGLSRPDVFALVVSNEPRYLSPGALLRAVWYSFALRPGRRESFLYAWSGRYFLKDKAGEVFKKALGLAVRPFYLALLKASHLACEIVFPLLNGKPRKRPYDAVCVKGVLVLSLDLIGDMVWAGPAVSSIKKRSPGTRVDLLAANRNTGLAGFIEGVDRVIGYDAPWLKKVHYPAGGAWPGFSRWRNLKTRLSLLLAGYDLVVDLRGDAGDTVLAYFTGAPYRAGGAVRSTGSVQAGDVSYLLTHNVPQYMSSGDGAHVVERSMALMGALGFGGEVAPGWLKPDASCETEVRRLLAEFGIKEGELVIGLQPGASRPEKRWDIDGFAVVAKTLMERHGARVVVAGSRDEMPLGEYITGKAPGAVNLCGRTSLGGFIALVNACGLFITNETSAISIASAVGTPLVCMMTGRPDLYGPYGVRSAVLQKRPDCWSPVIEHCFCPYEYRCLRDISPDEVLAAAEELLAPTASGAS